MEEDGNNNYDNLTEYEKQRIAHVARNKAYMKRLGIHDLAMTVRIGGGEKKKQKQTQVKEMKFRPGTDQGDYDIKLRNLTRFLENGDKAKVTLRFRGREMAHQQLGMDLLNRVRDDVEEIAKVEAFPRLEGRQMVMVLAPK